MEKGERIRLISTRLWVYPLGKFFELNQKWMKLRTDDMDFVMDTILEQAGQKKDSVYERIDTQKIGVFGHSMVGSASRYR